jgi:hypothetical protein
MSLPNANYLEHTNSGGSSTAENRGVHEGCNICHSCTDGRVLYVANFCPTARFARSDERNDGVWAAGNYSVTVKDKTIQGNWFRILKREARTWKIAMEAFARAGAIDAAASPSPAPTNGK